MALHACTCRDRGRCTNTRTGRDGSTQEGTTQEQRQASSSSVHTCSPGRIRFRTAVSRDNHNKVTWGRRRQLYLAVCDCCATAVSAARDDHVACCRRHASVLPHATAGAASRACALAFRHFCLFLCGSIHLSVVQTDEGMGIWRVGVRRETATQQTILPWELDSSCACNDTTD